MTWTFSFYMYELKYDSLRNRSSKFECLPKAQQNTVFMHVEFLGSMRTTMRTICAGIGHAPQFGQSMCK